MKIVINQLNGSYLETIYSENFENLHATFKRLSSIKGPLEAKIFVFNESKSSEYLSKFKNDLDKINVCFMYIYSNNRETIVAGKSLNINSTFVKEKEVKNELFLLNS